ncbi:MAG TPA: copper-binding protein, partial [Roseovarius nubinhibens]|nr:copper-binding protein [Roseovarius nubinhibens]
GKHVMFMGLTQPFREGESVPLTLTFEQAGDVVIEVPVDLQRSEMGGHDHAGHAGQSDHSGHGTKG